MNQHFLVRTRLERWLTRRDEQSVRLQMENIAKGVAPLGERIRALRLAADVLQRDVARTIGMDQTQISRIEHGHVVPDSLTRDKLAEFFSLDRKLL